MSKARVWLGPVAAGGLFVIVGSLPATGMSAGRQASPAATIPLDHWSDFNDDGFADLAIGAPRDTVGSVHFAGSVHVLYGSASGITTSGNQVWHQDVAGVRDFAEEHDAFGRSLAAGDFNGDSFGDLAIGIPGEDVGGELDTGAVQILFGSPSGLDPVANADAGTLDDIFFTGRVGGKFQPGDRAGSAVAALDAGPPELSEDATRDGIADLAVGYPGRNGGAGGFGIYFNSADQFATAISGITFGPAYGPQQAGAPLVAGRFGTGELDDLAVGVPGYDGSAGQVIIFYEPGHRVGHHVGFPVYVDQDTTGVPDQNEDWDYFGSGIGAGDVDGDGLDELFVGAPFEDASWHGSPVLDSGAVWRFETTTSGIDVNHPIMFAEGGGGWPDAREVGDRFGSSIQVANFGRGPLADVAISAPGESVGGAERAGAVDIRYSDGTHQRWTQDSPGIMDKSEWIDEFGFAISASDRGKGAQADLAIGVPYEDIGAIEDAGAVALLYGSADGLTAAGNGFWHRAVTGVVDAVGTDDRFGISLR